MFYQSLVSFRCSGRRNSRLRRVDASLFQIFAVRKHPLMLLVVIFRSPCLIGLEILALFLNFEESYRLYFIIFNVPYS
jgi:hypothetical protein